MQPAGIKEPDVVDQVSLLRNQFARLPPPDEEARRKWEGRAGGAKNLPKESDKLTERPSAPRAGLGNSSFLSEPVPSAFGLRLHSKAVVIVAVLAVVPVGLAVYWWLDRQKEGAERDRLEQMVQEDRRQKENEAAQRRRRTEELLAVVRPLLPQCRPGPGPRDFRVRGKVWVWDETTVSASGAN